MLKRFSSHNSKNILLIGALVICLSSCIEEHNKAPNTGINLESERIYGDIGGEPRQLKNEYPEASASLVDRIDNIRNKLSSR